MAGSVRHHLGYDLAYYLVLGLGIAYLHVHERNVVLHKPVHIGDVQLRLPEDPGHVLVHLHDQYLGRSGRNGGVVVGRAETEVAGLVHGRNHGHEDIQFNELGDKPGHLMKMVGM